MPTDSMEKIAEVVADLKARRYVVPPGVYEDAADSIGDALTDWEEVQKAPVIDATAIYQQAINDKKPWYIYEDHECIAPPWINSFVGFVNQWGNVIVTLLASVDIVSDADRGIIHGSWQTDKDDIDWERVRWAISGVVWVGGTGGGYDTKIPLQTIPTMGPVYVERYLVYEDGEPIDIRWVELHQGWQGEMSDSHLRVNLDTLNFMNCKNVDIVPVRPRDRAQRRRLQRTGVTVSTINVFPVGKLRRGTQDATDSDGVPLTSVRGHYAKYGEKYNRKKLFGKYEGRYWIPRHARGSKEVGEVEQRFDLHPE